MSNSVTEVRRDGGELTNGDHVKVGEVQFAKETGFLLIGERKATKLL